MNRFVLSPAARQDLDDIADYVKRNSGPMRALDLVSDLYDGIEFIAAHPNAGHARQELDPEARVWTVHSYVIVYWPHTTPLMVARIVHGGRDLWEQRTPRE